MGRYFDDFNDEITHYGVKGMKWGKKKVSRIDGSTPMKNRPRGRKRNVEDRKGFVYRRSTWIGDSNVIESVPKRYDWAKGKVIKEKPQQSDIAEGMKKKNKKVKHRSIKSRIKSALKR